jgi:hypothetical protein
VSAPDTGTANYSAAVALLTRQQLALDVPRSNLTEGIPADDVLQAMEENTSGVLAGVWPADRGAGLLEQLGLYFAGTGAAT